MTHHAIIQGVMSPTKTHMKSSLFWLQAAFLVSLAAVLGSLGLSEAIGLVPCELCWYQRILMYPMPFIFGAALAQKHYDVFWYVFPMVVIGIVIAAYHYIIQMSAFAANSCSADMVACTTKQVEYFGFVTIPLGSLLMFVALAIILLVLRKQNPE